MLASGFTGSRLALACTTSTAPHRLLRADKNQRRQLRKKEFIYGFIQKLKNLPAAITPSFEFTTIMAFEYFKQKEVDFAIIEVGLGGRLDATNIINPMISQSPLLLWITKIF